MTLVADDAAGGARLVLEVVLNDAPHVELQRYEKVPRFFNLDKETTVVGRSPGSADVILDSYVVPTSVSRTHFTITRNPLASTSSSSSEAPFLIQQKPSRNAIKLNGVLVPDDEPLSLRHGDEIRLCEYTLRLEMDDADRPKTKQLNSSNLVPTDLVSPTTTESCTSLISGERRATASSRKRSRASAKDHSKQDLDAVKAFVWTVGLQVEVLALEEGLRGAWFPAVVRTHPLLSHPHPCVSAELVVDGFQRAVVVLASVADAHEGVLVTKPKVHEVHNTHVVVEYPEYDDEENEVVDPIVTINGKSVVRCRPAPPASTRTDWGLNDHVEAPYEGAFWAGTVVHVCKTGSLMVQFPDPPLGEGGPLLEFKPAQLRPELSWAGDLGWRTKDGSMLVLLDEAPTTPPENAQDKDGHRRVRTAAVA